MAQLTLQGAQELRARLNAIQDVFEPVAADWADDATSRMRQKIRSPKGVMRNSLEGYWSDKSAEVWGDYRVIFIDRGTSEHGPKKTGHLKFAGYGSAQGRTIFAKRVRGVPKHPFIRSSASAALRANPMAQELVKAWNEAGRGQRGVKVRKSYARRRRKTVTA